MARDNFNKSTIDKLKGRVGHRCSNPSCCVPTSAAASGDKINNIGIAAHISAASLGGPRYNCQISSCQRKSINNAIWLCSNCSIEIDRDETKYPVTLLENWKHLAEEKARSELGQKLPSNTDVINTVSSALTGLPNNFIPKAISNVHKASEKALEMLDPRFSITSDHHNGTTSMKITPNEEVSCVMMIKGEKANEYKKKEQLLKEHGEDIKFEVQDTWIEGSELISKIFEEGSILNVSSKKVPAIQKIWLVQTKENQIEPFDDILGTISFGSKSFTFKGKACDDLFTFNYQKHLANDDTRVNITMSLNLNNWEGKNINNLPYFEKLQTLYSKLANGWELFTSLEINGKEVYVSEGKLLDKWEYILEINNLLNYTNKTQIIAAFFKKNILYTSNISFSENEHKQLVYIAEVIEGKQSYNKSNIGNNITSDLIADENCNNIRQLKLVTEPISLKIQVPNNEKIKLFNSVIHMPSKTVYLSSVIPKITNDLGNIKSNDIVKVEWVPNINFNCLICYEPQTVLKKK